jgi:hypothetical protein
MERPALGELRSQTGGTACPTKVVCTSSGLAKWPISRGRMVSCARVVNPRKFAPIANRRAGCQQSPTCPTIQTGDVLHWPFHDLGFATAWTRVRIRTAGSWPGRQRQYPRAAGNSNKTKEKDGSPQLLATVQYELWLAKV